MFNCDKGKYDCIFSNAIIGISASILLFILVKGFRNIMKDVNDILDKQDKLIYFNSILQQILLIIIVFTQAYIPVYSLLRILRVAQDLQFINCLVKLYIDNEGHIMLAEKIQNIIFTFLGLLLIIINIHTYVGLDITYKCEQSPWIFIALFQFILCCVQCYIVFQLLYVIHCYWKEQVVNVFDGLQKITMDELQNRQIQIIVLTTSFLISCTALIYWDHIANRSGFCEESKTLNEFIYAIGLLHLLYILPSVAVYYIYFVRNSRYLNSHDGSFAKNMANFCDDRSSIPLVDMLNNTN